MDIHLYVHQDRTDTQEIIRLLHLLIKKFKIMGKELDDLQAAVAEETTVDESIIALLDGIAAQLKDAGTDAAKIKAVTDQIIANKQAIADAVTRNTPAA